MADQDESMERAKKLVEQDKKVRERSAAEYAERAKGKPTPTQEENDLAAHGAHFEKHEEDGSPLDPNIHQPDDQTRHQEARKPAQSYQTRQATPARSHE